MAKYLCAVLVLSACAACSAWTAPIHTCKSTSDVQGFRSHSIRVSGQQLPFARQTLLTRGYGRQHQGLQLQATTTLTYADYKVFEEASRCSYLINTWKTQAEGARALGWTQPSGERSVENALEVQRKLTMAVNTADTLASVMPKCMQKAVAEKTLKENPSASFPENIMKMRLITCVSLTGMGSAAAVYTAEDDFFRIDTLVANTQLDNQDKAQKFVVECIANKAKDEGIPSVRLSASALNTVYVTSEELGFKEAEPGCPWLEYEGKSPFLEK